mgnify:CR=1 FL=1
MSAWLCFNPRTREGCDEDNPFIVEFTQKFQSTHPRGVRLEFEEKGDFIEGFQSTHPRGVRLLLE